MRVLGIDPGYDRCGIAVVDKLPGKKESLVFSTCIVTDRKAEFNDRLNMITEGVRAVIDTHKPDSLAIEKLFFNTNQKTAMRVAEVRGVLIQIGMDYELTVAEYTPLQVKSAVGGSGRALKEDVMRMIPLLIVLPAKKRLDDEYDAIAIGLTHCAVVRNS
jgi:crossover junction endodeoxyribonuclease RuvC